MKEVWEQLVDSYYFGENASMEVVSSHWREEDRHFRMDEAKEGGRLFSCAGMGPVRWESSEQQKLDLWCQRIHRIHVKQARQGRQFLLSCSDLLERAGIDPTLDVLRHACTATLLDSVKPREGYQRILLIGDGYGVLGVLLKQLNPEAQMVYVDLGKSLAIQANLNQGAFPEASQSIVSRPEVDESADLLFCPAEKSEWLANYRFDLALNVASMQEMTPEIVKDYFRLLRKTLRGPRLFYCCNRLHKTLPDGEISEILNYPWTDNDRFLIDEPCPWQQYFFATWKAKRGVQLAGFRLPYVNLYDGAHHHRLVEMGEESK